MKPGESLRSTAQHMDARSARTARQWADAWEAMPREEFQRCAESLGERFRLSDEEVSRLRGFIGSWRTVVVQARDRSPEIGEVVSVTDMGFVLQTTGHRSWYGRDNVKVLSWREDESPSRGPSGA